MNKHCVATIKSNFPDIPVFYYDIKKLLKTNLDSIKNICPNPYAVVGGPPCQAFSTAGKHQGLTDIRGTLIFDLLKV